MRSSPPLPNKEGRQYVCHPLRCTFHVVSLLVRGIVYGLHLHSAWGTRAVEHAAAAVVVVVVGSAGGKVNVFLLTCGQCLLL